MAKRGVWVSQGNLDSRWGTYWIFHGMLGMPTYPTVPCSALASSAHWAGYAGAWRCPVVSSCCARVMPPTPVLCHAVCCYAPGCYAVQVLCVHGGAE